MKRIIICCDGTWQSAGVTYPTNIVKLLESIPLETDSSVDPSGRSTSQILYYHEGVGTRSVLEKWLGGAFGWWLDADLAAAYRFLCINWSPGDEVYLFGFSRGAYIIRSLAGLVYNCGILRRQHLTQVSAAISIYRNRDDRKMDPWGTTAAAFRRDFCHLESYRPERKPGETIEPPAPLLITALGCFDTVGSMGVPDLLPCMPFDKWLNKRYQFHDLILSPIVYRAFHAVSVEEKRRVFDCTLMKANPAIQGQLNQVWFTGDHGCVGGGSPEKEPIANIALDWMIKSMGEAGLHLVVDPALMPGSPKLDVLARYPAEAGIFALLGILTFKLRDIHNDPNPVFHRTFKAYFSSLSDRLRPRNLPPGFPKDAVFIPIETVTEPPGQT